MTSIDPIRRGGYRAGRSVAPADCALTPATPIHFLGSPEGELAIAEAVVYMACAPKSNSIYTAFSAAQADATERGSLPVPLWIRNAPTSLMKALDYGKGYKYAHEFEDGLTDQEYFPDSLAGKQYYHPTSVGREKTIAEYLEKYRRFRAEATSRRDKEKPRAKPADSH